MARQAAAREKVREVMTPGAEVIRPDAKLKDAAAKLRDLNVGPLPVCDGERLVGMLTDRDITIRAVAEGRDPNTTPVREAMTPEVAYVFEDDPVSRAAEIMKERQIRRLPVMNRDKRLVGMLSLGDIAVETRGDVAGDILEEVSAPSRPER
jgi:CBS domain-containing protein